MNYLFSIQRSQIRWSCECRDCQEKTIRILVGEAWQGN